MNLLSATASTFQLTIFVPMLYSYTTVTIQGESRYPALMFNSARFCMFLSVASHQEPVIQWLTSVDVLPFCSLFHFVLKLGFTHCWRPTVVNFCDMSFCWELSHWQFQHIFFFFYFTFTSFKGTTSNAFGVCVLSISIIYQSFCFYKYFLDGHRT